jgi:DegV family protein with EDD domain
MVKIITDSTCNLDDELLTRHDIRVAPIAIQFGEETFEEGIDIDRDAFYARIDRTGRIPTTSQPSPSWFERFYREVHAQGDQALVITVTSRHSGTYQSAVLARAMAPQASVEVFDSASISLGTGWMVIEAARASERGLSLPAILTRLEHIRRHLQLALTPSTLRYLQMSGRVGKLQGAVASLLDVKPIIAVRDGLLEAGERVRTRSKALHRLVDHVQEHTRSAAAVNLAVIHARAPEEGNTLLDLARRALPVREVLVAELVASLAVHGGPGIVGLAAYPV